MTSFPIILINSLSVLMISLVIALTWRRRAETCARHLMILSYFMLIWSVGSFMESITAQLTVKIFWRNFTQIGVFGTPAATLMFAIAYTGYIKKRLKTLAAVIYSIQAAAVLFIFTDQWHHLARNAIYIISGNGFETLVVETMTISRMFISINFIHMAASLIFLLIFLFSSNVRSMKRHALCVLAGMIVSIGFSLIKVSSNEMFFVMLPISSIFALADPFMLLGIARFDMLLLAPLARNQVFNIVGDGIIVAGETGSIVDVNNAAKEIFCADKQEDKTEHLYRVIGDAIAAFYPQWHQALRQRHTDKVSLTLVSEEKHKFYLCELYPVFSKQTAIGSISVIRDITGQKTQTDILRAQAEIDGLTEVYNKKTFIRLVEDILCKTEENVCLIFLDVDHFKEINDRYGHIFGDKVLIDICALMRDQFDSQAMIGRMGGEEFAVFTKTACSLNDTAEKLRLFISEYEFTCENESVYITVSIGVASGKFTSFDELYRAADINLYKAKEAGRNKVVYGIE